MSIGIVGGGAWGTALACLMAGKGVDVRLWARELAVVESIAAGKDNPRFLPGVSLPMGITATNDLRKLSPCGIWLVVVPAQHLRATLEAARPESRTLVLCAKGIEAGTHQLLAEVAAEVVPQAELAVLSGPTFAAEVASGKPTAVTLACADARLGASLVDLLKTPTFRPYLTDDVVGAEIGGAVKNVLAIACGVVIGRGLGENARAALLSRGYAEMLRFAVARGARAETLAGLSGLGDLVLTCGSAQSRNMSLGIAIGEGRPAAELLGSRVTVAEGAATAPVLVEAAKAAGVEMPIAEAVAALLAGASVGPVIDALLSRPLRSEG
ncbi:NAD(P)H-dependent glycerol-3-phosphate dehydrogenase [Glacieibacterium sp.]|uniref:NAD(P)H-dependent glycerol-3-phosphate dehydrogenase n=1 Tax=Glacieibacterium sp. TaxID=2860237 RepID=UPI003AFFA705